MATIGPGGEARLGVLATLADVAGGELAVRSALGATRRRIVVQLFAEALVLGGVAAAVGLAAAHLALRGVGLPFLEAIRQFKNEVGSRNVVFMHLTLVP